MTMNRTLRSGNTGDEFYEGFVVCNGVRIQVSFRLASNATDAEKDAAFVAALAEEVQLGYLSVGSERTCLASVDQSRSRHWAITGRIPGDDEDSLHVLKAASREDAVQQFETALWSNEPNADEARANVLKRFGETVVINTVCVSDSPILQA